MRTEVDVFFKNVKKIRADFEKMKVANPEEFRYLKEKYEYVISQSFDPEPYVRKLFDVW